MFKYNYCLKNSFKESNKAYINSILRAVVFMVTIYVFNQLWSYIYTGYASDSILNGYNLNMMIWYLIMTEILAYSTSPKNVTQDFSNSIKNGKIATALNKPYNFFIYQVSYHTGAFLNKACYLLPAGILCGMILLDPISGFSIMYVIPILLSIFLSLILVCILYSTIGLLSFWIEESTPFAWIFQKFVLVLGVFFPVTFFPTFIQKIILYSPVYSMTTGPATLLSNFSWETFAIVMFSQIFYIVLLLFLGLIIYKIGIKKVNIYGG